MTAGAQLDPSSREGERERRLRSAPAPGEAPMPATDAAALLRRNVSDAEQRDWVALRVGDQRWTHGEYVAHKIIKRTLVHQKFRSDRVGGDAVYVRGRGDDVNREFGGDAEEALRRSFVQNRHEPMWDL